MIDLYKIFQDKTIISIFQQTMITIKMALIASFFAVIIGTIIGILIYITKEDGLKPIKSIAFILDTIINIGRSFPFIILIIAVLPFIRLITNKALGNDAFIIALTIAAIPFVARIMEISFNEIDKGVIEAAKAMGASNLQIIIKVLLPETIQNIVLNITVTIINVIGYSAMSGVIGGEGLGNYAIKYGYQKFRTDILIISIIVLILLVQFTQFIGNFIAKNIVIIIHKFKKN